MKHYLFLATTIATASLFTGCSNNEYVGDQPEALNGTDGAIAFSMGKANTTRTEEEKAAYNYFRHFYVYGEKTLSADDRVVPVFNTYKVEYTDASANSTASNTTGWEYVGITWGDKEKTNVSGGVENQTENQTIKYWDYSARKYTFYAFSANSIDVTGTDPKITVSEIGTPSTDPSYTVTIKEGASIGDLYFADKKVVNKNANEYAGKGDTPADKAVKLIFRNLASKVRVGFYETVPGYKINITKMYGAGSYVSENNFVAECNNTVASQDSKIKVTYITGTSEDGYAQVSKKKTLADANLEGVQTLTLGGNLIKVNDTPTYLATTSSSPTWDTNNGEYTFFWPQTNNGDPLKITVDYTLTSTDGSGETIEVKGATATVPKEYVAWKANTAYTYIFKISDNTNGTTGTPGDPAGLYPITFDAAVVDMDMEGSVTTVSTPSVTAKQDGATNGYVDANGIVFQTDKPIDLKVMKDNIDITANTEGITTTIKGKWVTNYVYDKTPEQNVGNTWDTFGAQLTGQSTAGYYVLKVTYNEGSSTGTTTGTTYVIIRVGDAEKGPKTPVNP